MKIKLSLIFLFSYIIFYLLTHKTTLHKFLKKKYFIFNGMYHILGSLSFMSFHDLFGISVTRLCSKTFNPFGSLRKVESLRKVDCDGALTSPSHSGKFGGLECHRRVGGLTPDLKACETHKIGGRCLLLPTRCLMFSQVPLVMLLSSYGLPCF